MKRSFCGFSSGFGGFLAGRIYVAELGCWRKNKGCDKYLGDLVEVINEEKWHWGFYSFREDTWDGMDYEMGPTKGLPEEYWKAVEGGIYPSREKYYPKKNPLWDIFVKELK
jgi:hypothetical protein